MPLRLNWLRINVLWPEPVLRDFTIVACAICAILEKFYNNIWKFVKCVLRVTVHAVFSNNSTR